MSVIKLNHGLKRVEIASTEIESELAFAYFDKLPEGERDAAFKRAFQIGVLAMQQDRLASFLAKTNNELGTELETLKIMFDLKAEIYSRSAVKGTEAEIEIANYLENLIESEGFGDEVALTGSGAGALPRNKTGDIVCTLNSRDERRIAIECKFDKGITLGELHERDWHGKNLDTICGQLFEAKANREADHAIIVLDRSSVSPAILARFEDVSYVPRVGFIAIVDSLRGDFKNLGMLYQIARDLALAEPSSDIDTDVLTLILKRITADLAKLSKVRTLVSSNIKNSQEILRIIQKETVAIEFAREYLDYVLQTGTLSKAQMLEFYSGGDVKKRFSAAEADIISLCDE